MVGLDDVVEIFHLSVVGVGGALSRFLQLPNGLAQHPAWSVLMTKGFSHALQARNALPGDLLAALAFRVCDRWKSMVSPRLLTARYRYAHFPLTLMHVSSTRQDRDRLPGRQCQRSRLSISGAQACTQRWMVVWYTETPRSSSVSSRSRQLTPYLQHHRTAQRMISPRKCRHLKSWVMGASPRAHMSGHHVVPRHFPQHGGRMHPKIDRDPMAKAECARQLRLTVAGRAAREAVRGKAQRLHLFCNSAELLRISVTVGENTRDFSRLPNHGPIRPRLRAA